MATYCLIADVKGFLTGVTISATTSPTETQVTTWIGYVSSEIDAILTGRGYSTQQSDSDALTYLKTVALNGIAALVLRAKHPTQPDIDLAYRQAYRDALADIREGRVLVPDADEDGDAVGEGFTLNSEGETYEPLITRETEF